MKTRWTLAVCVIALLVVATGPATANQDQMAGITIRSGSVSDLGRQIAPTCGALADPGFLLGQDPHDPTDDELDIMGSQQATWGTYITAETIDQAADPDWFDIGSLTVWGLSVVSSAGFFACDPTGMTFDVIFYEDNAGEPGAVICDLQSVVPAITNTGIPYTGFGFDLYQFDLPAACDLGTVGRKWVTVQNEQHPLDCGFLWLSGTGGDGGSLQDGGAGWDFKDNDRCICVNGATIPVELMAFSIE